MDIFFFLFEVGRSDLLNGGRRWSITNFEFLAAIFYFF